MTKKDQATPNPLFAGKHTKIAQIRELASMELGRVPDRLDELLEDVCALYDGKWQAYQQCQVGYHTITHALDVSLAAGRMVAGWNRQHREKINEKLTTFGKQKDDQTILFIRCI